MKKIAKKRISIGLLCLALVLLAIYSSGYWLPLPGEFLLVNDNLKKADCIVPLRGDEYWRFKKAVELYRAGYAKIIVTPIFSEQEKKYYQYYNFEALVLGVKDISTKEFALRAFAFFEMDLKDVYFSDEEVTSTYDEAVAIKNYMLKRGMKSMILLTSTYNTRRALMIFNWVFRGTGIKIYNSTAVNELYNPSRWWKKERDAKVILDEYVTIVYNIFYHFVLHKDRTSFDDA
jgi:uncharacterized SAM-binding protein YcdF (DUF218 family)